MSASFSSDAVAACAAELVSGGSLEMSPSHTDDAAAIAALLPAGTPVFVNHLPGHALATSLPTLRAVRAAGLEPVPHLAARRVQSRVELVEFVRHAVAGAGVRKVLLIGGDDPRAVGPYADALGLLRDGVLPECGVRELALPGYPEGHPRIEADLLERAFDQKLQLAQQQNLGASVVTQFSFAPARIVEYCDELARRWPGLPVVVGMAGPTSATSLLKFAQRCGVSTSLRALGAQGMGAVKLFMHTDPGEQLSAVAQYRLRHDDCNVLGVHLFSFGSAAKSARWMNDVITARRRGGS
ncbi:MAG TPA: methylenetetrahydrofolate reductase [Burkholderiaceae bacterium]|nr:methylenetetrahydrofolate reductase [Burkholderiaceae bacterium]